MTTADRDRRSEQAAIEQHCPHCDGRSYGGGARPEVRDGLVYRRRLCLERSCGREFLTVAAVMTERLALALLEGIHHADPSPLSLPVAVAVESGA